jgi:hypothetical protein
MYMKIIIIIIIIIAIIIIIIGHMFSAKVDAVIPTEKYAIPTEVLPFIQQSTGSMSAN